MAAAAAGAVGLAGGCSGAPSPDAPAASARVPQRVVSLDYCADQYVIQLADRASILAVSPDATDAFSYLRVEAKGLPSVRPTAEDVLALKPDLVVRSYGGGPGIAAFLEKAGVRVHQIGWGDDFDVVRTEVRAAASALGQPARGQAVLDQFDRRLAGLARAGQVPGLYMTSGGVTTGPGSMVHRMMEAAGLANVETRPGWHPLPLEQLVTERPAVIATAFFGSPASTGEIWSPARHPVARRALHGAQVASLDGATTACGGWFILDAVELLARTGRKAQP